MDQSYIDCEDEFVDFIDKFTKKNEAVVHNAQKQKWTPKKWKSILNSKRVYHK